AEAAAPAAAARPGADPAADECAPAGLRQRAAQVLVVGLPHVTSAIDPLAQEVLDLGVGGVFLSDSNVVDTLQVQSLTAGLQESSAIPLLVTSDEEAGRVSTFRALIGATSAPRTLAANGAPSDVRTVALELGGRLAELGVNADLAPVADLDGGPWNGVIGDRSFSSDPLVAADYAEAFAAGLSDAGVMPVVKHFPGHGRSAEDVHRRAARVDAPLEDLLATDLLPFIALIDAGAPIVMMSHVRYDALQADRPASLSPTAYRLLRDLGFYGVAMTDSIGMGAVHRRWDFPRAAVMALHAGADAVLATDGRQAAAMRDAIVAAVKRGRLDEARLDEAVARMLAVKGIDSAGFACAVVEPVPVMVQTDRDGD
ncbi:MAG: glycoside hydrolase family 3 protein, partial [Nitriliruptorales bacterium]|nr:glycoside hydrolase family 3 protein [Nitriliruptorales bacterium]